MFVRSSKMFPRSAYQRVYLNSKDALYINMIFKQLNLILLYSQILLKYGIYN